MLLFRYKRLISCNRVSTTRATITPFFISPCQHHFRSSSSTCSCSCVNCCNNNTKSPAPVSNTTAADNGQLNVNYLNSLELLRRDNDTLKQELQLLREKGIIDNIFINNVSIDPSYNQHIIYKLSFRFTYTCC